MKGTSIKLFFQRETQKMPPCQNTQETRQRKRMHIFKSSFSCKFTANSERTLEGQSVMEKERRKGDPGQRLRPPPRAHPTLCSGKALETWGHRQEHLICFISTRKSPDTQDLFVVTLGY